MFLGVAVNSLNEKTIQECSAPLSPPAFPLPDPEDTAQAKICWVKIADQPSKSALELVIQQQFRRQFRDDRDEPTVSKIHIEV